MPLVQNSDFCKQFKSGLTDFLLFNYDSVKDVRRLWSAVKGYIRDNAIALSSAKNMAELKVISDLECTLSRLVRECVYRQKSQIHNPQGEKKRILR